MSFVAIIGSGPIGAGIGHALATRARVAEIRLFDTAAGVAAGKALDIRQTGPIEGCDTRVSGGGDPLGAVGAAVIVLADDHQDGEWAGDRGLTLLRRLRDAGATSPLVLAGPNQRWLQESAVRELGWAPDRLIGTAASALVGAARALVALETDGAGSAVSLVVCGQPPLVTFGWTSATIDGSLLTDRIPAHRLLAITQQVRALWPLGPYAIAASTAPVVEALVGPGRRELPATTVLQGEFGLRGVAALLPTVIRNGRVVRRVEPSLSPQERNDLISALSRSAVTR